MEEIKQTELDEIEWRWKRILEATKFWPDASMAILMEYNVPSLVRWVRELEAENRRLKAVAEAARKLNGVLNTWPRGVTRYHPVACELGEALAALEEAKG